MSSSVCIAAVAGLMTRGTRAARTATGTMPGTATTTWVSVLLELETAVDSARLDPAPLRPVAASGGEQRWPDGVSSWWRKLRPALFLGSSQVRVLAATTEIQVPLLCPRTKRGLGLEKRNPYSAWCRSHHVTDATPEMGNELFFPTKREPLRHKRQEIICDEF